MAITYRGLSEFVRQRGNVKAWAENSAVTLLPNGEIDAIELIERDATRFEFDGRSYSREEFEQLLSPPTASGGLQIP
jgi:hypothetical protein